MARTKITITTLAFNAGVLQPAGTAADQANGMFLSGTELEPESIPANKGADLLVLEVSNTAAAAHNVIIRAGGAEPDSSFTPWPAFRGSLGDLDVSVTNATTQVVGPLETSRFKQSNGDINVDFDVGFTGTVRAYLLPKAPYVA